MQEPFGECATRTKPGGRIYGGGGGGGSSASTTSSNTTNTDKRLVVDNGSMGISADNSTVTVTDQGAIKQAGAIATTALTTNSTNFTTLMDTAKVLAAGAADALKANVALAGQLSTTTQSAYADAAAQASGNKNLVYAGMAVLGLAAVSYFGKKG